MNDMSLMQRIDDITKLLDINYDDYLNAKNEFIQNPSQASVKYFDYDMNSNNFIDFWFNYLSEYSNCVFHAVDTTGYTQSFENYIIKNKIKCSGIDYNNFKVKESDYKEILFYLLLSEINYNLDENYDVFGINIGLKDSIYYILEKNKIRNIKNIVPEIHIIDIEMLEKSINRTYILNKDIKNLKAGEFVQNIKDDNYITLYIKDNDVYNIPSEYLDLVL